jgi:cytochrome c biogenesis protein CcdA/thiol-disulfide isomerase/thioredoxin
MFLVRSLFRILFCCSILFVFLPGNSTHAEHTVDIVLFYGQGCPHCAGMMNFLEQAQQEHGAIELHTYEIYFNRDSIPLFEQIATAYGKGINAVPTTFIGNESFVGFSPTIGEDILDMVELCSRRTCPSPLTHLGAQDSTRSSSQSSAAQLPEAQSSSASATFSSSSSSSIGSASKDYGGTIIPPSLAATREDDPSRNSVAHAITIPAVIGAAVVDAINPCAFAVLIILITTILASGNRKRALFSGLAFSLSIFISYFLMGLGLYSAIQASGLTHSFYAVIGILAIVIGLFNLKDYFWYGKWFVMEVPMSWRPKLKALLHGVTSVPGAFFIGFLISLFLLPCTSGPYIVILGMLAHTTTRLYAVALLVLYNLIFVSPMLLITGAIFFGITNTEQAEAWRQKKLHILHLIAGLIILVLGIVMLGSLWLGYM